MSIDYEQPSLHSAKPPLPTPLLRLQYQFHLFHFPSTSISNSPLTTTAAMAAPTAPYKPAQMSRPRRGPTGDEEASAVLRLGEFRGVPSLNLSEARTIINAVTARRRGIQTGGNAPGQQTNGGGERTGGTDSETLVKVQEYLEMFARYKEQEHVQALEQLLDHCEGLDKFERSQLGTFVQSLPPSLKEADMGMMIGSLCPDTAEEAKTLVPSLEGKISDDELQELLDEMMRLRNFAQ